MSKIHLKDSPEPLFVNGNSFLLANCGARIERPQLAFLWDDQRMECSPELDGLRVCRKCRMLEFDHRYIYGIVQGEVATQLQEQRRLTK